MHWLGSALAAREPGLQEQSGMTGLASRVSWVVAAAASTEAVCAAARFSAGA